MPDVTLTDATLDEIEARAKAATPGLAKALDANAHYDGGVWSLAEGAAHHVRLAIFDFQKLLPDIPALIATQRASQERERRYETALQKLTTFRCPNCDAIDLARAALGEEATS